MTQGCIAQLEARTDDLEAVVDHLSAGSYAPSHPQASLSLKNLRTRCEAQLRIATPPDTLTAGQPAAGPNQVDDNLRRRGSLPQSRRARRGAACIGCRRGIAAEEAQNKARELSEKLSTENPAPEATE